jgi:sterol desaturase/sphingolipid hydroxylase (fatty acid hydroxylase superfamily)
VTGVAATAAVLEWTADRQSGLLYWLPAVVGLRSAAALLMLDLWSWFWHWACHRSAFLWRFHRVHHSDPDMDVTTAFRFHPGELFCSSLARIPVIWVLGVAPSELLVYEAVLLASAQFHHSALAGGFWDERLRSLIVTPAMHRIHHARERQLTNSNYASLLSCWDRLFGTWQPPVEGTGGRNDAIPSCGLDGTDSETWQSIAGMAVSPLRGDPVTGESG